MASTGARYRVMPNVVAAVKVIVPAIARNGSTGRFRRQSTKSPAIAGSRSAKY